MNIALNCEGHFLNLCCSIDLFPVGGSPDLPAQVIGPASVTVGEEQWGELFNLPPTCVLSVSLTLASYHTETLLNIPQQKQAFNITDTTNVWRNMEKLDLAVCYEKRLHSKYAPNGCHLSFLIPKMQFSDTVYFHYTLHFKGYLLTVSN